MRVGDPDDLPNPFAVRPLPSRRRRRRAVVTAMKWLVIVAIGLSVTVVLSTQSRRWLLTRLTADFETLSAAEKKTRLAQLSDLGLDGIEPLVSGMIDKQDDVARTAYELLRQSQNEWTMLPRDEHDQRHRRMIAGLRKISVHLPDDRSGWASGLLHQTIMEAVDRDDDSSRSLYALAGETLDQFALTNRAGPSVLSESPDDSGMPRRLTVRATPLPVTAADARESWTVWPPQEGAAAATAGTNALPPDNSQIEPAALPADPTATVYRSSAAPLQPVDPSTAVMLKPLDAAPAPASPASEVRPVTSLVDSPLETFDDPSVIHWLGSEHDALRAAAKKELRRRGFDEARLTLATEIVTGDVSTRIALVDSIARDDTLDPRPWLMLLLDDPNRDVKLRAISVLATMNDPAVASQLRLRLVDQSDPIVAARLRRVLDLR